MPQQTAEQQTAQPQTAPASNDLGDQILQMMQSGQNTDGGAVLPPKQEQAAAPAPEAENAKGLLHVFKGIQDATSQDALANAFIQIATKANLNQMDKFNLVNGQSFTSVSSKTRVVDGVRVTEDNNAVNTKAIEALKTSLKQLVEAKQKDPAISEQVNVAMLKAMRGEALGNSNVENAVNMVMAGHKDVLLASQDAAEGSKLAEHHKTLLAQLQKAVAFHIAAQDIMTIAQSQGLEKNDIDAVQEVIDLMTPDSAKAVPDPFFHADVLSGKLKGVDEVFNSAKGQIQPLLDAMKTPVEEIHKAAFESKASNPQAHLLEIQGALAKHYENVVDAFAHIGKQGIDSIHQLIKQNSKPIQELTSSIFQQVGGFAKVLENHMKTPGTRINAASALSPIEAMFKQVQREMHRSIGRFF